MASVTVNLIGYSVITGGITWSDDVALGSTFDHFNNSQTLDLASLYDLAQIGSVEISIAGSNDRFTSAFEATGRIIFTASDGESLEVMIANADMSEPYFWLPANSAQVIAFASHVRGLADHSATLTLTDDPAAVAPAFADSTGDAQSWTTGMAITPVTVPEATGRPTPTYVATGVPVGVSFNTGTRVISGTPTIPGSGTITVTATNSQRSDTWTVTYSIVSTLHRVAAAFPGVSGSLVAEVNIFGRILTVAVDFFGIGGSLAATVTKAMALERLLIADNSGSGLFEIDPDGADTEGTQLRTFPSGLSYPLGMTGLFGRLLIADFNGADLWEIDPDGEDTEGTRLRLLPTRLTTPVSMTLLGSRLLIADNTGKELFEIDPDGSNTQFTRQPTLPTDLEFPSGMTVFHNRLLIANTTGADLWEINPNDADGTRLRALPSELTQPYGMTVFFGRLLIVDGSDDEIWEINPDGEDTEGTRLRGLPTRLASPVSMTVFRTIIPIAVYATFLGIGGSVAATVTRIPARLLSTVVTFPGIEGSLTSEVTKISSMTHAVAIAFPGIGGSLSAMVTTDVALKLIPVAASFPGVGGSISVSVTKSLVPLRLADFNDAGLEVETAALLTASGAGTSGNNLYTDSTRSGSDSPTEGELGVGTGETLISRIRRFSTSVLLLNDNDKPVALTFSTFFGVGGDGRDLTISFQTVNDGLVSFTVADTYVSAGGGFVNFTLPAAGRTLLDNIATGDRFIFAMWRRIPLAVASTFPGIGGSFTGTVTKIGAATHSVGATFPGVGGSVSATISLATAKLFSTAAVFPGIVGSVSATVTKTVAKVLSVAAAFPGIGGSLTTAVTREVALVLSDFDQTGRTTDVLALMVRTESGDLLYRATERGGTDAPIQGELGVGPSNNRITQIIYRSDTRVLLNQNDANFMFGDYLYGDGSDLTYSFQTAADGVVHRTIFDSIPLSPTTTQTGDSYVNFSTDSAMQNLVSNIAVGDRFIFAMWRRIPLYAAAVFPGVEGSFTVAVSKTTAITHTAEVAFPGIGGSLSASVTKIAVKLLPVKVAFPGIEGSFTVAVSTTIPTTYAIGVTFPGVGGSFTVIVSESNLRFKHVTNIKERMLDHLPRFYASSQVMSNVYNAVSPELENLKEFLATPDSSVSNFNKNIQELMNNYIDNEVGWGYERFINQLFIISTNHLFNEYVKLYGTVIEDDYIRLRNKLLFYSSLNRSFNEYDIREELKHIGGDILNKLVSIYNIYALTITLNPVGNQETLAILRRQFVEHFPAHLVINLVSQFMTLDDSPQGTLNDLIPNVLV